MARLKLKKKTKNRKPATVVGTNWFPPSSLSAYTKFDRMLC